jgi:hypothetical protein
LLIHRLSLASLKPLTERKSPCQQQVRSIPSTKLRNRKVSASIIITARVPLAEIFPHGSESLELAAIGSAMTAIS